MSIRSSALPFSSFRLFALVLCLIGCGGSNTPVGSVAISIPSSSFQVGGTMQLHATDKNSQKQTVDVTSTASWSSSNASIVSVSASGLATANSVGTATINVVYGKDTGSAAVTVTAATGSLILTPANATFYVGSTQQFSAISTTSGTSKDVTSSTTWSATPASVATISPIGILTPVAVGTFTVTGVNGSQKATVDGTVVAVTLSSIAITPMNATVAEGATQQFTATGTYNDGSTRDITSTVNWVSSNSALMSINSTGLATAANNDTTGTVNITASLGGVTNMVSAQVSSGAAITNLVIKPTSSSIATGSAEQHTATAWYSDGTQKDVTNLVTWTSANSDTSAVNASGMNTAGTPGTTTLQATMAKAVVNAARRKAPGAMADTAVATVSSSSVVIVTPATIESLDISASKATFPVGSTQPIKLIGTFSDGSTQDLSLTANWQSSDPSIATIDQTGVARALSAGAVTFTGSFGGMTISTVGFQVLPASLVSATIAVDFAGQITGLSEKLKVIGTYSDGSTHDVTSLATFVSSDPSIFAVDSTGLAYGVSTGVAQITATVGGFSAITNISTYAEQIIGRAVFPQQPRLALGTHLQFAAGITGSDPLTGVFNQDVTESAVWVSSDPSVLTIDQNGLAKSGKRGTTTVSATVLGGTQYSDTITVTNAKLKRIVLAQAPASIAAKTNQQYTATGYFDDGSVQDVTMDAVWDTGDHTVASVDKDGTTIGLKPGQTVVTATLMGQTASTGLTVTDATLVSTSLLPGGIEVPINFYTQYNMVGKFSDGTTQNLNNSTIFLSPTPFVASFFPVGLGGTNYPGVGQLTAQYGYFSASTPITVSNANLTGVTLTPSATTVRLGDAVQLKATGTFDDGLVMDLTGQEYLTSSAPLVAPATRSGLIYGTALGTATLTADMYGQTALATVTVLSNVLNSIALTPANPSVTSGSAAQLQAVGTYADGTTSDLTGNVNWTSSNPAVLTVSSAGVATAVAGVSSATSVTVTANAPATDSHPAVSASFIVTIQPSGSGGGGTNPGGGTGTLPTGLQVTPTSTHMAPGTTRQLTATALNANGTTKDISSSVIWSSSNPAIARVSDGGLISAVQSGAVTIQAQTTGVSGTLTSSSTVIVSGATLQSLAISPSGASFSAGSTQQFTLTGTFTDGTTQDVSSLATWSSSAPAVATISTTGLATGVSSGTVQFAASYDGQTITSATNTVTSATLVSVQLNPNSLSLAKGTTQQFTVTGVYSDGSTRDLTSSATYSTSNSSVIDVNTSGRATATGVGSAQVTVTVGGKTASTQPVSVTPAVMSSITITPSTLNFANGTTQQFTAIGTFTDGTTQDVTRQVVWSSSNPQVLTVDQNGLATSGSVGSAQITATLNNVSSSTGTVTVTPAKIVAISISPNSAQIAKGTSQQFTATGTFTDGTTQNVSSLATWTSSDGSVVSIDGNGLATGTGVGSAELTASYEGRSVSTSNFQVSPATLVSLAFSPAQPTVASGTATQVHVIGTFSDGTTQDLTSSATFSSSNALIATVSSSGAVSGLLPGTSTITVSAGGQTSIFSVTVSAAVLVSLAITPSTPPAFAKGTTEQFTATGTFSDGTTQDLSSSVVWLSSNNSVFTVSNSGVATGTGVGTASLTATFEGQVVTTPAFQVTPAVLTSIAITPQIQSLFAGATQQYAALATYSDSSTADVSGVAAWSSSNPSIATVNASGFASAVAAGTANIQAQVNGTTGSLTLTVAVPALALQSITITPASASIAKGNTQQFTAIGLYSDGSTQNVTSQVTWQSSAPAIASIANNGVAAGVAGGNTQIWGSLAGQSAVSTLTVSPATLSSIAITPQSASIASGTTQQYKAIGTLSDGSTQDLTSSVNWSSSNSALATVSANGLAVTSGTGTATIVGTAGSSSSTATLTVTTATPTSIQVTPSPLSISAGSSQQLLVTASFTDGSSQNVTSAAVFTSSNPAVVTVDSNGKLKAVGPGSATVTITLNGVTSTLNVTIGTATVTSIAISPQNPTLAAGQSQQLTATATYSDGSTQDFTNSVNWVTSNSSVATVSPTGNVIIAEPGSATITGTYGGASGSVTISGTAAVPTAIAISPASTTLAVGQAQQFAATATLSDGTQQTVTSSVHWSVSSPGKATVSNSAGSSGLLTANAAGALNVVASLDGISGAAAVTIQAATLNSLTINPSAIISLPAGTSTQLSVTGIYSDGSSADVTSIVTWSTAQASTAYVDTNAVLHGVHSNLTTISAALQGITGIAIVNVDNATLSSIAITPATPVLALGQTAQLTATGTYSDGSTSNITSQVQWSSGAPSIATVSNTGVITTLASGSSNLTATLNGVSQSVSLNVTTAVLQSVAVQVAGGGPSSFALGMSLQLQAIGTYSDGSTQDLTSSVSWSSQTPSVGVVSSSGLATGMAPGTFVAKASKNGISGSSTITVAAATLVSIAITPTNAIIVNVSTTHVQFTAIGTFSDGSTQNLTNSVHWGTAGITLGAISATGSFTPTAVGLGQITATSGSVTGTVGFVVVSLGI